MNINFNLFLRASLTVMLSAALLGCSASSSSNSYQMVPVGAQEPYTQFHLLDGSTVTLDSFKGQKVALMFWASDCSESKSKIVTFNKKAREFAKRGDTTFLAVSIDRKREDLESLIHVKEIHDVIHAYSGNDVYDEAYIAFGMSSIPWQVEIDKDGKVVQSAKELDWDTL